MNGVTLVKTKEEESGKIHMIETWRITPNRMQPRKNFEDDNLIKLADSIHRHGILQPLTVRKASEGHDGYELVAGERRLRAALMLRLREVPCMIIEADERKSAELAIIENIQREDLNMFEQAKAISTLIDMYGLTQEEVARQLSTSQSYVANKLRILRLNEKEMGLILKYNLTERHARALLRIEDEKLRDTALDYIITKGLNVASTEEYIERLLSLDTHRKEERKQKFIIKDIRLFYNTIDRAVSTIRSAGIKVESNRIEDDGAINITIRIPKINTREPA